MKMRAFCLILIGLLAGGNAFFLWKYFAPTYDSMIHWNIHVAARNIAQYLNENPEINGLVCSPELKKLSVFQIGKYGYSALIASDGLFVCHPHNEIEGKNVNSLPDQSAKDIINKAIYGKGFARGFYQWYTGEKYLCIVPVNTVNKYNGKSLYLCYGRDVKDFSKKYCDSLRNSIILDEQFTPIEKIFYKLHE